MNGIVAVTGGVFLTYLSQNWLASRQFAINMGLSRTRLIGAFFLGGPAATLTPAGWLVFTAVYAGLLYALLNALHQKEKP